MVNAKRIFFIICNKVYEAFDFGAPRFIQVMIRKLCLHRACSIKARLIRYIGPLSSRTVGSALQKATKEMKILPRGKLADRRRLSLRAKSCEKCHFSEPVRES